MSKSSNNPFSVISGAFLQVDVYICRFEVARPVAYCRLSENFVNGLK